LWGKKDDDIDHARTTFSASGVITYLRWHICHLQGKRFWAYFFQVRKMRFKEKVMKKYVIERDIPKVGSLEREQLKAASAKSNEALRQVGAGIQWQESYVADDKTFCIYLAENEGLIHKHAELSGFPASKITEIKTMIDPTTGGIAKLL
jgi:hypothetical protein